MRELISLKIVKRICQEHNIYPRKRRGQNFLINKKVLENIIYTADLRKDDVVLEIGPGLGVLTEELVKRVKKVLAVEIDKKMIRILKENMKEYNNLEIIEEDILSFKNLPQNYKIVANLPYQITSAFLRKFLEIYPAPKEIIILLQKEAGEQVCAKPGKMSFLSLMVQFYSFPKIIKIISKNSFWPKPKVDSVLLKMILKKEKPNKNFFSLIKMGFSRPRKQLANNLSGFDKERIKKALKELNLQETVRPEELSLSDWLKLNNLLAPFLNY